MTDQMNMNIPPNNKNNLSAPDVLTANKPTTQSSDWFYMQSECTTGETFDDCIDNEDAANNLRKTNDRLGATVTQYNDAKMLYNRELLFTVNILAGLAMLCYYIYLNQSVFPSPTAVINSIGEVGKSMTTATTTAAAT
jgi:hypothetical protein